MIVFCIGTRIEGSSSENAKDIPYTIGLRLLPIATKLEDSKGTLFILTVCKTESWGCPVHDLSNLTLLKVLDTPNVQRGGLKNLVFVRFPHDVPVGKQNASNGSDIFDAT